ncbi:MAG: glycoside hydrolase family 3 C-terminal domain-containing protein, partial [Deltaproteobacteria bacterium]|nr:glycoside hydrolase family 3 C-terminal domain-containing protein [Deltaproteobacteria bacterium]
ATAASYGLMAEQLHELGINVNLAPVLDVMTDPAETSMYTRSFGERTDEVVAHARAAVRATRRELVIPTPKHFPGQTAAPGDEHTSMPVAEQDEDTLRDVYLAPFVAAIEAGAEMIMPTHARFNAWDPDYPATLSHAILTDLLRDELGFEGVIITDDVNMVGVTGNDWGEMPDILAIQAGADMVMDIFADFEPVAAGAFRAAPYPETIAAQIEAVAIAVEDGRIEPARIDESVRRILALKMKYCLFENPFREAEGAGARVDTPAQHALAASLHDRAVTLVRDDDGLVPIDSATTSAHVIAPALVVWEAYPTAGWPNLAGKTLLGAMRAYDPTIEGALFGSPTSSMAADAIVAGAAASDADVIVVATYNARDDAEQADMVQRILALGRPTIVVSLAMPYDLSAFPDAPTYLAAYSNRDLAVESVARVLYGVVEPTGRLPVGIPGLYGIGYAFEP